MATTANNIGDTNLDGLLDLYRSAIYSIRVSGDDLIFNAGEKSPDLDALCVELGVTSFVFISASNPHSVSLTPEENAERTALLERHIMTAGYAWLSGKGRSADESWPAEKSYAIFGMPLSHGVRLARALQQNAVLWFRIGLPVDIVPCR